MTTDTTEPRRAIFTENAPRPGGHYSQAIVHGPLVYVSGQVPVDPATGKPIEGGIEDQTRRALLNIRAILAEAGLGLDAVIKTTCFLSDASNFAAFNTAYKEFFPSDPPARSTVGAVLPGPYLVEIEALAVRS
jgi:2-iminobutanoate/2-iminopropanoate deaminase